MRCIAGRFVFFVIASLIALLSSTTCKDSCSCYVMLCYFMLCYVILCHIVSCYVMLCNVTFCYILFNSIQFNSIQFNSIQFNSVQFNSIQFNPMEKILKTIVVCKTSKCNKIKHTRADVEVSHHIEIIAENSVTHSSYDPYLT